MTVDTRWRALVLVDAARSSMSAAAERGGVTVKTIVAWRKLLASDPELAGHYAQEWQFASDRVRDEVAAAESVTLARIRELIPDTTVGDLPVLLSIATHLGELRVQDNALNPRKSRKDRDASPADRGGATGTEDPEIDSGDPRH
mgnify:CR=1 FL=1